MSYRPICDFWYLARSKVKYYGAYPAGFLERARALMGVGEESSILHVCGGKVREYPYERGCGPRDLTLDLDPNMDPDFLQDARNPYAFSYAEAIERLSRRGVLGPHAVTDACVDRWFFDGVMADPPYTDEDADKYAPGRRVLPTPGRLLRNGLDTVKPGGRVGILAYTAPRPPSKTIKLVATAAVVTGFDNRIRIFSVYEKPWSTRRVRA